MRSILALAATLLISRAVAQNEYEWTISQVYGSVEFPLGTASGTADDADTCYAQMMRLTYLNQQKDGGADIETAQQMLDNLAGQPPPLLAVRFGRLLAILPRLCITQSIRPGAVLDKIPLLLLAQAPRLHLPTPTHPPIHTDQAPRLPPPPPHT